MQHNEDDFNFEDDENILDTSINLRINSKLKSDFEKLCKKNHSSMSRELKLYISACLERKTLKLDKYY